MQKYLFILVLILLPYVSFGAYTATDNFDSYTSGNSICSGSGGSGWTSNWCANFSGSNTASVTQYESSPNSVKVTADQIDRTFTATNSGTVYYSVYKTGDEVPLFYLRDGGNNFALTRINGGNFEYYDGNLGYTSLGAISSNTWHRIGIEIDDVNQDGKARYQIDGGSWSAWLDRIDLGSSETFDRILIWGTGNSYIDNVSPDYSTGGGSPAVASSTYATSTESVLVVSRMGFRAIILFLMSMTLSLSIWKQFMS